jgi:hypothetical protein
VEADQLNQDSQVEQDQRLLHDQELQHDHHFDHAADFEDLSQGLSLAGLAMLVLFMIAMLAAVVPSRLADPAWQQGMVTTLVDDSVVALVALVLLHLAVLINPTDPFSGALRDKAARWAVLAALLHALLVSQQLVVALRSHQTNAAVLQRHEREISQRFVQLRQTVRQARGHADLQRRLEGVVGPSFGRLNPAEPLPKLNLAVILRQNEHQLRQDLRQRKGVTGFAANGHLLSPPLWARLSCLAFALAFAALARRRGKRISLLASLMLTGRSRPLQDPEHQGYEPDKD